MAEAMSSNTAAVPTHTSTDTEAAAHRHTATSRSHRTRLNTRQTTRSGPGHRPAPASGWWSGP
ncbi:hypothetical protein CLV72_103185 [Allonocardiopsis opalescens]|uniref:Uncharacterized protein n=1 Tax=Allonocardiopsis opalescens TaxID=1144618 RepID=A0A2T0Q792_9ACTN|nr:hypothetical protein CLV72_103185 [Allonocardiopsis opalescens]